MGPKHDHFISVVLADQPLSPRYLNYVRQLHQHLSQSFSDFEILAVTPPSAQSSDHASFSQLLTEISHIRWLPLTAPTKAEIAWSAGMENAIGDFVVFHAC